VSRTEPFIVVLCCRFAVGTEEMGAPVVSRGWKGVRFVRLACGASIHPGMILSAIEEGASGVLLVTCPEDRCRFETGSRTATEAAVLTRGLLQTIGLKPERIRHVENRHPGDVFKAVDGFASDLDVAVEPMDRLLRAFEERGMESVR